MRLIGILTLLFFVVSQVSTQTLPGANAFGRGFNIFTLSGSTLAVFNLTIASPTNITYHDVEYSIPTLFADFQTASSCSRPVSGVYYASLGTLARNVHNEIASLWPASSSIAADIQAASGQSELKIYGSLHGRVSGPASLVGSVDRSFYTLDMSCKHGEATLVDHDLPLASNFITALQALPLEYNSNNKASFQSFFTTYGTHYIKKASLGTLGALFEFSAFFSSNLYCL